MTWRCGERINAGTPALHSIIVVAEGAAAPSKWRKQIEKMSRHETRVTVLGHTQWGGTPTAGPHPGFGWHQSG